MVSTIKYSHNLKVRVIWCECLGLWVRETASQELWENCSKEAGEEVRLYTSLQQGEQAVCIAKNRYQVKEFSILCLGRCEAPGLLNSCLSHAPQLSGANPVYLASGSPPAPQQSWTEGGSIHWITVWGAPIHFWRPEITHGRDIFCLLIWPEIFSFYNGKQMTTISQDIN